MGTHAMKRTRIRMVIPATLLLLLGACDQQLLSESDPPAVKLEVSTTVVELRNGQAVSIKATLVDAAGRPVQSPERKYAFRWFVADPSLLRINGAGPTVDVEGVNIGSTNIFVSATEVWTTSGNGNGNGYGIGQGLEKRITANVRSTGKPSVRITESLQSFGHLGESYPFVAQAWDADGTLLSDVTFEWESTNPAAVTAASGGTMTAKAVGTTLVIAAAIGLADTLAVKVEQVPATIQLSQSSLSMSAGETRQLQASVHDAGGNLIPNASVVWRSSSDAVATVSGGLVSAKSGGTAIIEAHTGGVAAQADLTVAGPAAAPVSPSGVPLQIVRMKNVSGNSLVSSGIPLPPGMLYPTGIGQVQLFVNGSEQSIHVSALNGRHRDGSLRSILVQFSYPVGGTPLPAELRIGSSRSTSDRTKTAPAFDYTNPAPDAVALPTSADYLLQTELIGPTLRAPAPFNSRYESRFVTQSDGRWEIFSAAYGGSLTADEAIGNNYYDRALSHWAWWMRTADPEYWHRANRYLMAWRELYARRHNYSLQPHQMQVEGLELHYLLTGDEESLRAAGVWGANMQNWLGTRYFSGDATEGRIQSRVLQAFVTAYRLNAPGGRDWKGLAKQAIDGILAQQRSDGSYRWDITCGEQLNYMAGLINEVMTYYYDHVDADARIPQSIDRSLGFLWNTQWLASDGAFKYNSGSCSGVGGPSPAPDLNLMFVQQWGWMYRRAGDAKYRSQGDAIFAEGVQRAWFGNNMLQANKQFNENYRSSWQYLHLRQ
jgi:hypothetical protein